MIKNTIISLIVYNAMIAFSAFAEAQENAKTVHATKQCNSAHGHLPSLVVLEALVLVVSLATAKMMTDDDGVSISNNPALFWG